MKQPNTGGRRRGDVKKEQGEEQGENKNEDESK